ncbi:MAG: hypothetical protein AAGB97_08920 [Dehalococcoidia bacterium]
MAESAKVKIGDMSIEDFKALISESLDEKLAGYRLVRVDEQGYMYILTEESLLPPGHEFEEGLEESIKQGEDGQLVEQGEIWSKLGI